MGTVGNGVGRGVGKGVGSGDGDGVGEVFRHSVNYDFIDHIVLAGGHQLAVVGPKTQNKDSIWPLMTQNSAESKLGEGIHTPCS